MRPILKSHINGSSVFGFWIIYGSIIYFTWNLTEGNLIKYLIVIISPILTYITIALWVNRYYFFYDRVKIVYFFRFCNREKVIPYSKIKNIRYVHTEGAKQPMIVFVYEGKTFSKLFKSSNSCTHRFFKNRMEILKFLASKGIPIEINSVFEKDEHILD
jgi:hypothetical protein